MKKLLFILLLITGVAGAATITVNSSQSAATINGAISACGAGCTINFTAGTYSIGSSEINLTCNDTVLGPAAAPRPTGAPGQSPVTVFIVNNAGNPAVLDPGGCTGTTIVKYMGTIGQGGGFYFYHNLGTITFEYNDCSGTVVSGTSGNSCLHLDGSASDSPSVHNFTYKYNWFHDACPATIASSSDLGGLCNAFQIEYGNDSGGFIDVENNWVGTGSSSGAGVEEGFKSLSNSGNYPLYNVTLKNNDFQLVHRLGVEFQNWNPSNNSYDSNSFQNWFNPFAVTGALSVPMWYPRTGPAGGNGVTHNTIVTGAQVALGNWFYAIELGGNAAIAQYNIIHGTWQNGITCYNSPNMNTTLNTIQGANMAASNSYLLDEENDPVNPCSGWTTTPNTTGATTVQQISTAPGISPSSSSCGGTVNVTLSDSGYNHSIFYTTNGSTPSISSTLYVGTFAVACGATVKAIGMWGQGANALTWPTGQGWTASSVITATYTSSGGSIVPTKPSSRSGTFF